MRGPLCPPTHWLLEIELVVKHGVGPDLLHGVHVGVRWQEGRVQTGHCTVERGCSGSGQTGQPRPLTDGAREVPWALLRLQPRLWDPTAVPGWELLRPGTVATSPSCGPEMGHAAAHALAGQKSRMELPG